jgi:hypothetical protein
MMKLHEVGKTIQQTKYQAGKTIQQPNHQAGKTIQQPSPSQHDCSCLYQMPSMKLLAEEG